MAERELATIVDESATRFHGARVVAEHRVGMLGLGEASVAIAVAHAHRGAAYEASRYVIEEIKRAASDLEARALRRRHAGMGARQKRNGAHPGAGRVSDALRDQFGRSIEYLRISVTDRCNFRCVYCMPAEGLQWLPKAEILSYEEIAAIVRAARAARAAPAAHHRRRADHSPRPGALVAPCSGPCPESRTSRSPPTASGSPALAAALRAAGLDRVNMSADSLRADRIAAIARRNLGFDPVRAATRGRATRGSIR